MVKGMFGPATTLNCNSTSFAGTRPLATEQAVRTLYPKADDYTIPETAHFLMMEKPIKFNRMLLKFVEQFK
jgi:pimeloyl-ACP methyl ester carboxylesterase